MILVIMLRYDQRVTRRRLAHHLGKSSRFPTHVTHHHNRTLGGLSEESGEAINSSATLHKENHEWIRQMLEGNSTTLIPKAVDIDQVQYLSLRSSTSASAHSVEATEQFVI